VRESARKRKRREFAFSSDDDDDDSLECPLCFVRLESQALWSKHLFR